jgi:hypothetical protein
MNHRGRPTRRVLLGGAVCVLGLGPALARAGEVSVVEDWRRQALASRGIPAGWEAYPTPGGHPAYDFTVVDAGGGRRALHLKSHGDRSTIARLVNIDLAATHPSSNGAGRQFNFPRARTCDRQPPPISPATSSSCGRACRGLCARASSCTPGIPRPPPTPSSEDPDPVRAVGLSIDTNDTGAHAEAFVGPIAFRTPS